MRLAALEYLACPSCQGQLVAETHGSAPDGHVMTGELFCACGARYPVREGVPRLMPQSPSCHRDPHAPATAKRFGQSWRYFDQWAHYYEQQFLDWVAPMTPRDFTGKLVLDAGCGKGRHAALIGQYGARAVVSLDISDGVDVAFAATRHLANVHVVQGDVLSPPLRCVFEVGFAVGVLHHLSDPMSGVRGLHQVIVRGGRVAVWVYGYESNEWLVKWLTPLRRRVTSKLPARLLYWAALPSAVALSGAVRLYRWNKAAAWLPYGTYLNYISEFPLRELHSIVFDQLATPVTHYLREAQVRDWFQSADFVDVDVTQHNGNSWRASANVAGHGDQVAA